MSPYLFILSAILAHKVQQDPEFKGIKMFKNDVKLSLFAEDTNLFITDLASVRRSLRNSRRVWEENRLLLKCSENKSVPAFKMGKEYRSNPHEMEWTSSPVKILGVYFSYDDKGSDELNIL